MKVFNERVPVNRMSQFDEILKATGGYYLANPIRSGDVFLVDYHPTTATMERWNRVCTEVKEVRKDQWWRKILRRIGMVALKIGGRK